MQNKKMTVGVVMGGISAEHPVSLVSGSGMFTHLDRSLFQPFPILITRGNQWLWPGVSQAYENQHWTPAMAEAYMGEPPQDWEKADFPCFTRFPRCDIMLLGLHGVGGEDGRLQGFLELAGQRYTGSDARGCVLAMDKILAKQIYRAHGIPTAPFIIISSDEYGTPSVLDNVEKELGYPVVVKDPMGGSSLGMGMAHNREELNSLVAKLGKTAGRLLAEKFIKGREATCGVLSNGPKLPPTEICPKQDAFFTFDAKYVSGRTEEITPATFAPSVNAHLQELAAKCHSALQLSVYSRTDFIVAHNEVFVLETNNLPGFTPTSFLPQQGAAAGLDYSQLLTLIVEESLNR